MKLTTSALGEAASMLSYDQSTTTLQFANLEQYLPKETKTAIILLLLTDTTGSKSSGSLKINFEYVVEEKPAEVEKEETPAVEPQAVEPTEPATPAAPVFEEPVPLPEPQTFQPQKKEKKLKVIPKEVLTRVLDANKAKFKQMYGGYGEPPEPLPKKKMMFKYKMSAKGNMSIDFGQEVYISETIKDYMARVKAGSRRLGDNADVINELFNVHYVPDAAVEIESFPNAIKFKMAEVTTSTMEVSVEFQNPDTVSTVGNGVDSMSV